MERKFIIILTALGVAAGIYGAITCQWILMLIAVTVIVLILIGSDIVQWLKSRPE